MAMAYRGTNCSLESPEQQLVNNLQSEVAAPCTYVTALYKSATEWLQVLEAQAVTQFARQNQADEMMIELESICGRGDSNPHALEHHPLKMACLPVPPLPHGCLQGVRREFRTPEVIQLLTTALYPLQAGLQPVVRAW